jgi:hypothetical protein
VVAIGTSLPELVTVILSRLRGHDDVGVGTVLGSNLFNGLAIVGIASSIHPIAVPLGEVTLTLASGVVALLLLIPDRSQLIPRWRGPLLLLLYGGFVWATLAAIHSFPRLRTACTIANDQNYVTFQATRFIDPAADLICGGTSGPHRCQWNAFLACRPAAHRRGPG